MIRLFPTGHGSTILCALYPIDQFQQRPHPSVSKVMFPSDIDTLLGPNIQSMYMGMLHHIVIELLVVVEVEYNVCTNSR